jgi:hypothetical protein
MNFPSPHMIGAARAYMNHSIHSADRMTHLKIVVLASVAGIAIAGLVLLSRAGASDAKSTHAPGAVKAVTINHSVASVIR